VRIALWSWVSEKDLSQPPHGGNHYLVNEFIDSLESLNPWRVFASNFVLRHRVITFRLKTPGLAKPCASLAVVGAQRDWAVPTRRSHASRACHVKRKQPLPSRICEYRLARVRFEYGNKNSLLLGLRLSAPRGQSGRHSQVTL
jgi:hypothetical protein